MTKYIDAYKLKAQIEWLYYNEAEKDESILAADAYKNALDAVEKLIDSLQQEQQTLDLDADIEMEWHSFNKHLAEYGEESEDVVWLNWNSFRDVARKFYELGQLEMRHRITNPEYNEKVVEQLKSEYPAIKEE